MRKEKENTAPDWAHFQGYAAPNYTMVPDELFDEHLAFLSGAELKVLLYVIRRTFGFKKDSDSISLSQMLSGITTREGKVLDRGVGLSKPTLLQALRSLVEEKGLIIRERRRSADKGDEASVYKLRLATDSEPIPSQKTIPPVVKKFDQGGGQETSPGPWSKNLTTQETGIQETGNQDLSTSNVRRTDVRETDPADRRGVSEEHNPVLDTAPNEAPGSATPQNRHGRGFVRVGDVLAGQTENTRSSPPATPQKTYPEERQQILSYIRDFARELGDEAPLPSSVSRAYNLWEQSGIPIEVFSTFLYEARSKTWKMSPSVKKHQQARDGTERGVWGASKNRMPYFFSVLEELVRRHAPGDGASSRHHTESTSTSSIGTTRAGVIPPPDPRASIERYIEQIATKFGDEAPLKSSQTRAHNLYEQSGVPLARFLAYLFEAQSLTEEYSANITKQKKGKGGPLGPDPNRMAYFFAVLENRIGTRHNAMEKEDTRATSSLDE